MTDEEVVRAWVELCDLKTYFSKFSGAVEAVEAANRELKGEVIYGIPNAKAEKIGEWCQTFWEALPDSGAIRREPFFKIRDIAKWQCFGDD